jgi:hypothetical protein
MNFMRLVKKENVKMFSFIIIAVIAISILWSPTYNYMQFYKAIEKLDITVSRSSFTLIPENYRVLLTLNVTIKNPTGYKGIGIVSLVFTLKLITNNTTIDLKKGYRIWFKDEPGEPIDPYSSISKSEELFLNFENNKDIFEEIEFLQRTGSKIDLFLSDASLDASLFLGRMFIPLGEILFNDP